MSPACSDLQRALLSSRQVQEGAGRWAEHSCTTCLEKSFPKPSVKADPTNLLFQASLSPGCLPTSFPPLRSSFFSISSFNSLLLLSCHVFCFSSRVLYSILLSLPASLFLLFSPSLSSPLEFCISILFPFYFFYLGLLILNLPLSSFLLTNPISLSDS